MQAGLTLLVGAHRVSLRPVADADRDFLRKVYGSTREEELAPVPWSAEDKGRFLDQQFAAQDAAYRNNYDGAVFLIIVVDGEDAGRLYVHERPREIRIMDIALLPAFRGRRIGSALLTELLARGRRQGGSVSIHVEVFNPARHLYERLGFKTVANQGPYLLLEWRAEGAAS